MSRCEYCGGPNNNRSARFCSRSHAARAQHGTPLLAPVNMRGRKNQPGATHARGYGNEHQKQRAEWKPAVDAGHGYCHAKHCLHRTRWIPPGTPWDLGHNETRTAWTGPEHRDCNRSDGGRRSPYARRYAATSIRVVGNAQSRLW